jgi:SSS family solute:Na+ symporter
MKPGILGPWGLVIFPLYLGAIILISLASRRRSKSSNDYLNASRSLPTWAAALSFLAYNCGSIEVIGMSAMAAQYGVQALHFYWIGGIPGMIFLAIVVLPIYMRTGARSLPEYLGMRFGPKVRLLNACVSMASTAAFAGVALYALSRVLHVIVGWSLLTGALVCASVVFVYVVLGGFRATVYTSVFQFFVMIAGIAPLVFLTVHFTFASFALRPNRWHLWKPLPLISSHAALDCFGVALGLGFVIGFSYWCTDFVMIQRALTARTVDAARKVPLLAGFGKLGIALLIVLPGAAAPAFLAGTGLASLDETMPALMAHAFGQALLALGTAALLAGLMAGLAGNVSGFSALWVEEVYRIYLRPSRSEQHYIRSGGVAVFVCMLLSESGAYATFRFHDLMEFLQLILALFYSPVFAAVLAGLISKRTSERGAFAGILLGVCSAFALQIGFWRTYVYFGSQMSANFYAAILSFTMAMLGCMFYKRRHAEKTEVAGQRFLIDAGVLEAIRPSPTLALLSAALLLLCAFLNMLWW